MTDKELESIKNAALAELPKTISVHIGDYPTMEDIAKAISAAIAEYDRQKNVNHSSS